MIDTNYLEITSRNGVTVITLNRAPVNAFNWALIQQLSLALRKCAEDSTVHALVIASKSPRVFSAGADLKGLANMNASDQKEFGKSAFSDSDVSITCSVGFRVLEPNTQKTHTFFFELKKPILF